MNAKNTVVAPEAIEELTYEQIQARIAEWTKKGDEIREREINTVLVDIKDKIKLYKITQEMLGFEPIHVIEYREPEVQATEAAPKKKVEPNFCHPENPELVWFGRGSSDKWPGWVVAWFKNNPGKTKWDLLKDPSKREDLMKEEQERKRKAEEKAVRDAAKAKEVAKDAAKEVAADIVADVVATKTPEAKAESVKTADVKVIEPVVKEEPKKGFFGR